MLIIQREQMQAFEQQAAAQFEARALSHLRRWFPRHALLVGDDALRRLVRLGWQRANAAGLEPECCVLSYLDLMCLMGSGFADDPLLPWAGQVLTGRGDLGAVQRGDLLHEAAWTYIRRIVPDYRDARGEPVTHRLVQLFREVRGEPRRVPDAQAWPECMASITDLLSLYFPAKCDVVGASRVMAVGPAALAMAQRHGVASLRGVKLFSVLRFVLGHQFDQDPLLPWVPAALGDASLVDLEDRVDRLMLLGAGTLRRWWDSAPVKA